MRWRESPGAQRSRRRRRLTRTFIGFYVGRQDTRFLDDNLDFDHSLRRQHISHVFKTYPGGHSSSLWRSEAHQWLGHALGALAAEA